MTDAITQGYLSDGAVLVVAVVLLGLVVCGAICWAACALGGRCDRADEAARNKRALEQARADARRGVE